MSNAATKEKIIHWSRKSPQFNWVLNKLRKLYEEQGCPDFLATPYILTSAAYLEALLNDSLFEAGHDYGDDVAQAMMSLSLPTKLKILVPSLTKGQYEINKEHFIYQRLASLIKVRNAIAHAKTEERELWVAPDEFIDLHSVDGDITSIPKQLLDSVFDLTLGTSKTFSPIEYHEALEKLDKWFFRRRHGDLKKVAMVVERRPNPMSPTDQK